MNKCGPILLAIIWLPLSPQLKTHAADTAVAIGTPNTLIILADDKHKNEPKTFENCEEFIVQLGSQSLIDLAAPVLPAPLATPKFICCLRPAMNPPFFETLAHVPPTIALFSCLASPLPVTLE